jgi:hypothetical protein
MSDGKCVREHIAPYLEGQPEKVRALVDFVARVADVSVRCTETKLYALHEEAKELFEELEQETRDELIEASQYNLHR